MNKEQDFFLKLYQKIFIDYLSSMSADKDWVKVGGRRMKWYEKYFRGEDQRLSKLLGIRDEGVG